MSDKKSRTFPLKRGEIESMMGIANEYVPKADRILRDHYSGVICLSSFTLSKVCMIHYYCHSLKTFIEKNFDTKHLAEGEAFEAHPQEVQQMAKIILTMANTKQDLAAQNIFLENQ